MNNKQYLENMIKTYKDKSQSTANIELELGVLGLNRDEFAKIFTKLREHEDFKNARLVYIIDFIYDSINGLLPDKNNLTKYIKSKHFDSKGQKIADVTYKKERLIHPLTINNMLNYNIKLSKEESIDEFRSLISPLVRFKVRAEFDFEFNKQMWRIDMSFVRMVSFNSIKSDLMTVKKRLFEGVTIDNILDLDPINFNKYEMEIEHNDPTKIQQLGAADLDIISAVWSKMDAEYMKSTMYQSAIYKIASVIVGNRDLVETFKDPTNGIKKLANQVIMLTKRFYFDEIYPPEKYYVAPKLDGIHCLGYVEGSKCVVLNTTYMEFNNINTTADLCIFDGEWIEESQTLFIFDCMQYEGKPLHKEYFETRLKYLPEVAKLLKKFIKKVEVQDYNRINGNLEDLVAKIRAKKRAFNIDGLIFTEPNENYKNTKNYKFKDTKDNTIDFLALRLIPKYLNMHPFVERKNYDIYLLFNGISSRMFNNINKKQLSFYKEIIKSANLTPSYEYFPTHFESSANPLSYVYYHDPTLGDIDGKIVELSYDKEWVFSRVRIDREVSNSYFGNDFRIAELTYVNYIDEFTVDCLWDRPNKYVVSLVDSVYKQYMRYKTNAIGTLMKRYLKDVNLVLDISPQDISSIINAGASNVIFIDKDPKNIADIIIGKFKQHSKTHIAAKLADFGKKLDLDYKANVVTCTNIQEFCDGNVLNLFANVKANLMIGGYFICVFIEGENIFDDIKQTTLEFKENDTSKYIINGLFKSTVITGVSQKIKVTDNKEHDEFLVSRKNLIDTAKLNKFNCILNDALIKFANEDNFNLTEADREFLQIYRVLIFQMKK